MRPLLFSIGILLISALGACFSPDYGSTGFTCSDDGECPSGYQCLSDNLCHRDGTSLDGLDASTIDADPALPDADTTDADPAAPDADVSLDADIPLDADLSPDADPGTVVNNVCGSADLLINGIVAVGTLTDATNTDDYSCGNTPRAEVFYSFTLAGARKVTLTLGSTFDTTMVLLAADCATEFDCADNTALGESIINENLAAGTYFVAIESTTGMAGSFTLELNTEDAIVRPPNDDCDGTITLADGVTRSGEIATLAVDDVAASCGPASKGDVVYEIIVPAGANRRAVVSVSNATGFDPVLSLAQGVCPGTEILCAQTSDAGNETLDIGDLAPGTYSLWVDGADAVTPASFDIRLDLLVAVATPTNDSCAAPDVLAENDVVAGSTTGAFDDHDLSCAVFDSKDTVHELTLDTDSALLVTLEPLTDWALAASLRTSADCLVTSDLTCLDGAFVSRFINSPDQAAGTYDVIVDGIAGDHGDYEISYETRPVDSSFGYWQISTTGVYTPLGAGATSFTIASQEDEAPFSINPLPFNFPFFGLERTSINLHINGFASFDPVATGLTSVNFVNDCSLDTTTPFNIIAPFWDDLIGQFTGGGNPASTLKHEVQGVAPYRRLVIEWGDWDIIESDCSGQCAILGASVSHQAILYENGDIEFRYGPRTAPTENDGCTDPHLGCAATIGLRNSDGTDNDEASCDTADAVDEGTVIYFVHPR